MGDALLGARLALLTRVPTRVVLVVGEAPRAAAAEPLQALASSLAWERWLPAGEPWAVRGIGGSAALRHPLFVAQRVKDGIVARFASRGLAAPPVDPRAPRVVVEARIGVRGAVSLGLDLSASSLHVRGAARRGAPAPLREDVAAGIALLAGAHEAERLFDPCCGSGTLIAEAASLALGLPPGRFAERMPLARLAPFRDLPLAELATERRSGARDELDALAADRDPRALAPLRAALAARGLEEHVRVVRRAIEDTPSMEGPALLLSNPPWGRRLADAEPVWRALGTLARRLPGWELALLSGDPELSRHLGLRARRRYPIAVGGVDARLLLYAMRPLEEAPGRSEG